MKIDLSRFRETFFQESAEHVNNMDASLLGLGDGPAHPEVLNSIFRAAHSIKGGSGTFGFDDVTRFTHRLEELLDRMRSGNPRRRAQSGRDFLRPPHTVTDEPVPGWGDTNNSTII